MRILRFFITTVFLLSYASFSTSQTWNNFTTENSGLANNTVRAICIDDNDIIWFGTADGLTSFDGSTWTTYTTDDNLAHNSINSIAFEVTSYGPEIWVATDGGVSVISVTPDAITFATPYRTDNTDLMSNTVYTAAVDTGHVKRFGTDIGLSSFDGNTWQTDDKFTFLPANKILSVYIADDGWGYYGTEGGGVGRYDGVSSASPYDTMWSGISSDNVYASFVDADGVEWFGTDSGLASHTGDETKLNWTKYTTDDGLSDNFIYAIAEDSNGVKWFGTANGVTSFDGQSFETYTTADGLAGNTVYAITIDSDGCILFGTNGGVSKLSCIDGIKMDETPASFTIWGNYPNPFNMNTTIEFSIPEGGFTSLIIYNITGQKVRELVNAALTPGIHSVQWDGTDDSGLEISSGMYISRLTLGSYVTSNRMVTLK